MDAERRSPGLGLARFGLGIAALGTLVCGGILLGQSFGQTAPGLSGHYVGARLLPPGPGHGGLPLIPVRVAADGSLEGVPAHLDWYSYCNPMAPGLSREYAGDSVLRYSIDPERVKTAEAQGMDVWFKDRLSEPVKADDFTELSQGASAEWRSNGAAGQNVLRVVVLRVDPLWYPEPIRSEFVSDGFIAFNAADTHLCCVVGYRETNSPLAKFHETDGGLEPGRDLLIETCHDDRYDPLDIQRYGAPAGQRDYPWD